ncbi:Na+/H+ antiporter NhaA [Granulosicoccus sp. 3-233]|uniref:Na+/H+ antiporter NhaA n=1 Tax=Granulosicoccus sp. 3-233 TaxID=3417969 RepID=UPI003D356BEE
MSTPSVGHLDRPVDASVDHVLGPQSAPITLVEYGSYACPHCRAANGRIAEIRDRFGDRLRYVFRHLPLSSNELSVQAAELAESAPDDESFWKTHIELMTRSHSLTEEDLDAAATHLSKKHEGSETSRDRAAHKVEADTASAKASGAMVTPTFFINGQRYDGPWDESAFIDAMEGTLGYRVRSAALDFAAWGPSSGVLLLAAVLMALVLSNVGLHASVQAFWETHVGVTIGENTFDLSLHHLVNDGLLTIFFLVVGLEIKREFTVGKLADPKAAALPITGALGGMIVPAILYLLLIPRGDWSGGWGITMATDTAFAIALIVAMGERVPIELRVFLTAAAIVDDIGAILVVALFYSEQISLVYMAAAGGAVITLYALNRARVYTVTPYVLAGFSLWVFVLGSGLHPTLAGVLLALFIPTRPPVNIDVLMTQAKTLIAAEAEREGEVLRHGPSLPTLRVLESIQDRLESPADRLLRIAAARSSYFILPLFALANAGVPFSAAVFEGHGPLMLAIGAGLVLGKPLGIALAAALVVWLGIATKPAEYSWLQLAGAGCLAGIGFTMSIFIAGQAFATSLDVEAATIGILGASTLAALCGFVFLLSAGNQSQSST